MQSVSLMGKSVSLLDAAQTPRSALKAITAIMLSTVVVFGLAGCDSAKSEAQDAFKAAASALDEKNAEVDAAIADLQAVFGSEIKPLDEAAIEAAEEAISAAQGAKVEVPEIASDTEAINGQTAELEEVDYTDQLDGIARAKTELENSIKQREQVTNPSEAFVIQRLTEVEHIQTPTAVTEDRDPNGLLGKQGGYTATIYFASDLVDQSAVPGDDLIERGTDGGGAVEVYPDESGAKKRNEYLAGFDGGMFSSGSHSVCGTCVIRTSDELTASQQKELEAAMIEALTRLE